jgi:Ca-activated chloride channel family protein
MTPDHLQDYYTLLGLAASANAQDIKASYRSAARRFHPDVNPNVGASLMFNEIQRAYEVLSDSQRRAQYDRLRERLRPDPQFFSIQTITSKRVLPQLSEPQVLYILLQINANKELASQGRQNAPLNLGLVLDRSKSMQGARLDRVKVAAHQIIDQMTSQDYLSIIVFSDYAETLVPSVAVVDKPSLKAAVNLMNCGGGTEIYQGLSEGLNQVRRHFSQDYVNHIILLTDGETYDDKNLSLNLANDAAKEGVGISAMGIGSEWNDVFLDEICSKTGGSTAYINSAGAVVRFLNERVKSLGASFAERLTLHIAPDPDVKIESLFKLVPYPQPISSITPPIQLGGLEYTRPLMVLIQLQISATTQVGFRSLVRFDLVADILNYKRKGYRVITDLSTEIASNPAIEEPPRLILDALGKLTLYRMQQKAEQALKDGRFNEATRKLEALAERLLMAGHAELAQTARLEAQRIRQTQSLSEEGRKTIKFGTRLLLGDAER